MIWSLDIPNVLSWLYYFRPVGQVEGIMDLQAQYEAEFGSGDYIPLVALDYWMFRIMVGVGLLMVASGALALFISYKKWPDKWNCWLKWMVLLIALPYIANTSGWILTETARQPWIVHGLLLTRDGVSPTSGVGMVLISLIGFFLIYTALIIADVYLLVKYAKAGPIEATPEPVDLIPSVVGVED